MSSRGSWAMSWRTIICGARRRRFLIAVARCKPWPTSAHPIAMPKRPVSALHRDLRRPRLAAGARRRARRGLDW
jgi:hypothetical protein